MFRDDSRTAELLDTGEQWPGIPMRAYTTYSTYLPAKTAVLELVEHGTLTGDAAAHGSAVVASVRNYVSPGYPDIPGSSLVLRNDPLDGAGAELASTGDVQLSPFAGDAYRPAGTVRAPRLLAGDLQNFRFVGPTLVLTDASGYYNFTFPVPFASACWFVDPDTTGDFGYSFQWTAVSWSKTGVRLRAGKNDGTVLGSTSLFVVMWAAGT